MTFRIDMKCPDCVSESIRDAAIDEVKKTMEGVSLASGEDFNDAVEEKENELRELCRRWFRYNEYLTVEIDTETQTIRVVEQ